jgi:hypothetical protein
LLVSQFRVCDASTALASVANDSQDTTTVSNGIVWTREYTDNSKDLLVFNPTRSVQTVEELTSDAVVWLLHADSAGNWVTGRLFHATTAPTYTKVLGFLTRIGGDNGTEVQYEITF